MEGFFIYKNEGLSVVRLKGFEPLTHCLEGSCSIQLSYRRINRGERIRTSDPLLPKQVR